MITYLILKALLVVFSAIFIWLPQVQELPWGLDSAMIDGVALYKKLAEIFPPFTVILQAFLIYLAFRIAMVVLKFFLGARSPEYD